MSVNDIRHIVDVNRIENHFVWACEIKGVEIAGVTIVLKECTESAVGSILCKKEVASHLEGLFYQNLLSVRVLCIGDLLAAEGVRPQLA